MIMQIKNSELKTPLNDSLNRLSTLVLSTLSVFFCSFTAPSVKDGLWRAVVPTVIGELPFHIKIETQPNGGLKAFAINGAEELPFDSVYFKNDSLHFVQEIFDAEIIAKVNGLEMDGIFKKKLGNLSLRQAKFKATYGLKERFITKSKNHIRPVLASKYSVTFRDASGSYQAVGLFQQNESKVTGTFLTTTGDYRYLQGETDGDSLKLSCFDGNHIYLFTAKVEGDKLQGGKFGYSITGVETWEGETNSQANLPNPASLTYLKPGYEKLAFSFPDINGKMVSHTDPQFQNKVTIIQILGSWCPNCMDETRFLSNFYKKNKHLGVEVVGLAFEKSLEPSFIRPKIEKFKTRFDVQYPILLAGLNDKNDASAKLPMLNKVISFPTTIILDRQGRVRKTHTGFTGPGTGSYYLDFVKDFEKFIEKLLLEK
jgi:thiol-disulfide isomerase/thioredoxin